LADDWASFDLSCGDFCFEVYWGDFWRRIKNEESFRGQPMEELNLKYKYWNLA
jgi:hypothetical protein